MGKTSTPSREAAKKVQEARFSQVLARLFERAGTESRLATPFPDFEYCAESRSGVSPITPTALITRLWSVTEQTGLGEAIGHYFPQIPPSEKDTAQYPHPLTDDFWEQYCEPLEEFRWTVTEFQTMMDNLSHAGPWERDGSVTVMPDDQLVVVAINPEDSGTTLAELALDINVAMVAMVLGKRIRDERSKQETGDASAKTAEIDPRSTGSYRHRGSWCTTGSGVRAGGARW